MNTKKSGLKNKKAMTHTIKAIFLSLLFLLFSCEEENNVNPNESHTIKKEKLTGYVQKGPFINGTSINISELSSDLIQTGKTFSSQISDNRGSFELRQLDLSSQFVELKADGFYYNENMSEAPTKTKTIIIQ